MPIGRPLSPWQSTAGRYSPVMLSVAKHLGTPRTRPFTELTLSGTNGLRVTIQGSSKSDTKKKQQEAAADEAILRLYHDESLKNTLHCHLSRIMAVICHD